MPINSLLIRRGQDVVIHLESDAVVCPCRTPEGYRDPEWHREHPDQPECNDAGFLFSSVEHTVKAILIPASSSGRKGMSNATQIFGEIKSDDHIGVFAPVWNGYTPQFDNFSPAGENYILFQDMKLQVISWARIPDPANPSVMHHWEVALRRINEDVAGVDYR